MGRVAVAALIMIAIGVLSMLFSSGSGDRCRRHGETLLFGDICRICNPREAKEAIQKDKNIRTYLRNRRRARPL